jgi:alpha-tubulin suppressor-like RCC1 family protein
MKRFVLSTTRMARLILILFFSSTLVLSFQNCGKGFEVKQELLEVDSKALQEPVPSDDPLQEPTSSVPAIVQQPVSLTVISGGVAVFSVVATGTTLNYQWLKNGMGISGATDSIYSISSATAADTGSYSVVVKNSVGQVTSLPVTLNVVIPPGISQQPQSRTVTVGGSASFSVAATGTNVSYQWKKNGANLVGATNASLNMTNLQATDAGSYSVVVSNSAGSVTSSNATLTVNPVVVPATPPTLTQQPQSKTSNVGSSVSFSVTATGTAPLTYQWKFNGMDISGANAATYMINSVQESNAGNYSVFVMNAGGSVTSQDAVLTVVTPPTIVQNPMSQTAIEKQDATFYVVADGSDPLTYQWQFNNTNIAGATQNVLRLSNISLSQAGKYTVVVKNAAGTVTSQPVDLVVKPLPKFTVPLANMSVTEGDNVKLTVNATGEGQIYYYWSKDGVSLPVGNLATLDLAYIKVSQAGVYSVQAVDQIGVSTTSATITVTPRPNTGVTSISAGYLYTCAVTQQQTAKCWGSQSQGQLGDGVSSGSSAAPLPVDVLNLNSVSSVTTGSGFACALKQGKVYCWGTNEITTGNGPVTYGINFPTATEIPGLSNVSMIAAGSLHVCALSQGNVFCFGYNGQGELGTNLGLSTAIPTQVSGVSQAVALSASNEFSCALMAQGNIKCWGYNTSGQLGSGGYTGGAGNLYDVVGINNATAISSGGGFGWHTCALLATGTVKCWGGNQNGQLGTDSSLGNSPTPISVAGLSGVKAISAGGTHTCAILNSGAVKCWGDNAQGGLGNNSYTGSSTPVDVIGMTDAVTISCGTHHTCVITSDNGVKCWGYGPFGQLGDNNRMNSPVPVDVVGLRGSVQ